MTMTKKGGRKSGLTFPYRSCRIWGSGGGPKNGGSFGLPYKIYGDPPGAGERSTASSGTPGGTDPRGRCPGRHVEYGGRACTLSAERIPNPASPGHVEVHMYFVWGTLYADALILERFGLRHTNTWGIHHVIWLTNECIFPKVDRWGRIYFECISAIKKNTIQITRSDSVSYHLQLVKLQLTIGHKLHKWF